MHGSSCFRTTFGSQSVHKSQTQVNSAGRHYYPNFAVIQNFFESENISFAQIHSRKSIW